MLGAIHLPEDALCACPECVSLDALHPNEGHQLALLNARLPGESPSPEAPQAKRPRAAPVTRALKDAKDWIHPLLRFGDDPTPKQEAAE